MSRSVHLTNLRKAIVVVFLTLNLSGCSDKGALLSASAKGMQVDEVVNQFGAPTVDRPVAPKVTTADPCSKDASHVRVLEYHRPDKGLLRSSIETLGFNALSSMTLLCLDSANVVRMTIKVTF
jgi:hypothetical protein